MSRLRSSASVRTQSPQITDKMDLSYKTLSELISQFLSNATVSQDDETYKDVEQHLESETDSESKLHAMDQINALITEYELRKSKISMLLTNIGEISSKVSSMMSLPVTDEPPTKKRRRGTLNEEPKTEIIPDTIYIEPKYGSQVAFRLRKFKGGEEEWIQCDVTKVITEGVRYEVRDPEPDENGNLGQSYRASIKDLIVIPPVEVSVSQLPMFTAGSMVLARYPETTTFYRANVSSLKRDGQRYRLNFEGEEEEGKETDVERRYVLPLPK